MPKTVRYVGKSIDLAKLADSVEAFSRTNGFETRTYNDRNIPPSWFEIQSLKTGVGRTIVGARRCLDTVVKGRSDDFDVTIGTADWGKNIAASLITGTLTLGIGFIWAGASALTYKVFEEKLWRYINHQIDSLSGAPQSNKESEESLSGTVSTLMFCRECGSKIPRDSKYCEKCGANLQ